MNKKNFLTLALVSVLAFSLANCAKSEDDNTPNPNEVTTADLVGTWKQSSTETYSTGSTEYTTEYTTEYKFVDGGRYEKLYTYIQKDSSGNITSQSYSIYTGSWSVEGGAVVTTEETSRYSNESKAHAESQTATQIATANQEKIYQHNALISADKTKLTFYGKKGGNTADLTGTWGSLTSPSETVYRYDTTSSSWKKASEDFSTFTFNPDGTITNYKYMSKYWYEGEAIVDFNGDSDETDWYTDPYYYKTKDRTYSTTEVVNDGDTTGITWSYSNGTITMNFPGASEPSSNAITIFGSAGYEYSESPYTKQ